METLANVQSAADFSALAIFLFTLAILIHFILLSTDRYNWLDGAAGTTTSAVTVTSTADA